MLYNNKNKLMITCKFCNKEYKTYQSRSNHIKIYHTHNNTPKTAISGVNLKIVNNDIAKTTPKIEGKNTNSKKIICEYCNYEFTRSDSLKKHYSRCKTKNSTINILKEKNELLELKLTQQTEIIKEMKEKQSEELEQMKSILNELLGFYETMSLCE